MGLAPFCKDTFFGQCRLRVWRRVGGAKQGPALVDATSSTAALEVRLRRGAEWALLVFFIALITLWTSPEHITRHDVLEQQTMV